MYADIFEDPVFLQFLRAIGFYNDEADDEDPVSFKFANEKVSPKRWDSSTVVHDIFRVVQDVTLYRLNLSPKGDVGRLSDL